MDSTSPELAAALLLWIKSFPQTASVESWRDLEDGFMLWHILEDIDSGFFRGGLPETDRKTRDNWIPRWQNLKHIDRLVTTYIRDECDKLHYLSKRLNPDLKAIATDGSVEQVIKLVKSVLLAAMYSAKSNERMIGVMQSLGPKVAGPIAMAIGEMEDLDQKLAEAGAEVETGSDRDSVPGGSSPAIGHSFRDPELEYEERMISAMQDKRRLENLLAERSDELEIMREKVTSLEEEIAEAKLISDRRRRRTMDVEELQKLTMNASRDKDYITELETDMASATATIEQQERQLERYKADEADKQELRDELHVVKAERDELRQKAKANENLKKKIQAMQEQEKANNALRNDLAQAHEQLQDLQSLRDHSKALEKIIEENAQAISNGEQEIFDQKEAKKRLQADMKILAQKFEQTREVLNETQERNRELEEQVHDFESGQAASTGGLENLDAELNEAPPAAEADKRKSMVIQSPTANAEALALQQNLSIANASINRLETRCLDLLQENLGYKAMIDEKEFADMNAQPFQHQTKRLEETLTELDDAKSKYIAATSEITELRSRLAAAETTNGTPPAPDPASLQALAQNQERQQYTTELEKELHDQKALLRHALLSNPALQREDDIVRSSHEYKLVLEQLEVVHSAPPQEAPGVIAATATNLTDKIEQGRIAAAQCEIHIDALKSNNAALAAELAGEKSRAADALASQRADETATRQVAQLQKESRLVASAWYDLTTRLQSNTVLLARRQELPRTMIGRARAAVHQGTYGAAGHRR